MNNNYKINNNNYKKFIQNLSNKKIFLIQVFSTLIFQIFIAYVVLLYAEHNNLINKMHHILLVALAGFIIIITIGLIKSRIIRILLLTLFSGIVGLLLSYRLDLNNEDQNELVKKSFLTTVIIFIYIVIFGFFLSFLGARISFKVSMALFLALLVLIIAIFILSISGKYPLYKKGIAGVVILLFSCFIAYDTVQILDRNYNGDFIDGSLDYFLDFINLFSGLLNYN